LRVRVRISGLVQGVGFRYFVSEVALSLALKGWVRNMEDGSVEALFDGEEDAVNRAVEICRAGPPSASVESIEVIPENETRALSGFKIAF
jgi:acylphosphatase